MEAEQTFTLGHGFERFRCHMVSELWEQIQLVLCNREEKITVGCTEQITSTIYCMHWDHLSKKCKLILSLVQSRSILCDNTFN